MYMLKNLYPDNMQPFNSKYRFSSRVKNNVDSDQMALSGSTVLSKDGIIGAQCPI